MPVSREPAAAAAPPPVRVLLLVRTRSRDLELRGLHSESSRGDSSSEAASIGELCPLLAFLLGVLAFVVALAFFFVDLFLLFPVVVAARGVTRSLPPSPSFALALR
jgi:hypothetical protein